MNRLPHLTQPPQLPPDQHLSDEQMFGLLELADHPAEPEQSGSAARLHLAACAACRQEFAGLRDSLANFRVAATGFAAAEGPKHAPRLVVARQPHRFRRHAFAASFATAVVLLVSFVHVDRSSPVRVPISPAIQAPIASESDEALLDGIQTDLSTSIPPSLEPLAVPSASGEASTKN